LPQRLRTLHLDTGREMRGGQWQVLYLLERLKNATLLAPREAPLFEEAKKRGIRTQPLSYLALRSAAKRSDIIHAHDAHAHTMAAMMGAHPLVVARRVAFPVRHGFLSHWKYAHAEMYLAVSKFVASRLIEAGVGSVKVRVVPDGVPVPDVPGHPEGRVIALANKPVEIPGVEVHLTTNLWEDLATASVFVYKSELEGLGSAALAAMAMGVPVVASAVGGLPEVVEHEKTGLLVNENNFADPVKRLLANPEWAARLGQAGRTRIESEFSVEMMVERTLGTYREVTAGGNRS
jgi:glycosyltransferase involved in cell wall biosynthesis